MADPTPNVRPTPEAFKLLPFGDRFKQNKQDRNSHIAWILSTTITFPLLTMSAQARSTTPTL